MKIGVLIVGSLYWDDSPPRAAWRSERLDCVRRQRVRVSVRYGRRSSRRGDSYTMVFSSGLREEQFGTAIAIPFKSENLLEEGEHLWAAEAPSAGGPKGRISARWGCVALLEHPQVPLPRDIRARWTERVVREPHYGKLDHAHDELSAVDERGLLGICWPRAENGSLLEMDALLATATCPTLNAGDYPSSRKIADAWSTLGGRKEAKYFWCNRKHGITTFQDAEIEARLRELGLTPGGSGVEECS